MKKIISIILIFLVTFGITKYFFNRYDIVAKEKNEMLNCSCSENPYFKAKIGLTDKQINNLTAVDKEFIKYRDNYKLLLCKERIQLGKMLLESNSETELIYKKIHSINKHQNNLNKLTIDYIFKINRKLDTQQKTKFMSLVSEGLCK